MTTLGTFNPERTVGPVARHRSAGRWLTSARYIVGWESDGIIKVGSTMFGRARYGKFLSRGAEIVDLAYYPELIDSLHAETWLLRRLGREFPAAFSDREEAMEHLPLGGGWTECFAVPACDWPTVVQMAHERGVTCPT